MTSHHYPFGKALSGGSPIDADALKRLRIEELNLLRDRYSARRVEKSSDPADQRLEEELDYVRRTLDLITIELEQRGAPSSTTERLKKVEDKLEDLADVAGAADKCQAVRLIGDEDLRRRMSRPDASGRNPICSEKPHASR